MYCIVFGITFGAEIGMTAAVLIDVIGLNKFILGYGIQLFFWGIGLVIGPPIIGNKYMLSYNNVRCIHILSY